VSSNDVTFVAYFVEVGPLVQKLKGEADMRHTEGYSDLIKLLFVSC
jgi:hypothetical protein